MNILFETFGEHQRDMLKQDQRTPLYHQLHILLRRSIHNGTFADGIQMPTEAQLSEYFEVSRITAKRAMDELAKEGLVERHRGRGTRVVYDYEPEKSINLKRNSLNMGGNPALLVVDVINGFTDANCPLGGHYPEVIEANKVLLSLFRELALPVFFTTVFYTDDSQAKVFRRRLDALNLLTSNSELAQIHPDLGMRDNEVLIVKHWASAFHKTDLDDQLRARLVDSIVITGLTTSGCVRASVVDGLQYDYPVFVPREAVGDRNQEAHRANLFDMHAKYADVISIENIKLMIRDRQSK